MINWQADLAQIRSLDPSKKVILSGALFIIFLAGLVGGLTFLGKPSPSQKPSSIISGTILSLSPAKQTLSKGEAVEVKVELEGQVVPVADISLTYDPTVFAISDLTPGEVFTSVLNSQADQGQISFSASVDPSSADSAASLKTGTVFSFQIKALKSTQGQKSLIDYNLDQTLTAKDGQNTLAKAEGAEFKVN